MPSTVVNPPTNHSLDPYSGPWTKKEAAHLLRRALFGLTFEQLQNAVANGLDATIDTLLTHQGASDLPLTFDPAEPVSQVGEPWNTSVYPSDPTLAATVAEIRAKSLGAWMMKNLNNEGTSITQKMCLFWHNHWAAELSGDMRSTLSYYLLIRDFALGNFKEFVKQMTINTCMLEFQDGATNTVYSPNENYAREFLELFTIGKGIQVGPGDYSNYTEEDVAAGAKIFTGYTIQGLLSDTQSTVNAVFYPILHDNSTKQLSHRFDNATIAGNDGDEFKDYIDVVFQQEEVARFISRKLYRYFVNSDLTTEVEENIIPAMAAIMVANDYEIKPVLEALLKSQHFYDVNLIGSCIRSPLEMLFSMINTTHSSIDFDIPTSYEMYMNLYGLGDSLGQSYGMPPSVSGWQAYYQAPAFTKLWVNSTHIRTRMSLIYFFTQTDGLEVNGNFFKVNGLGFLDSLSNPSNANDVIDDMIAVMMPKPLTATKRLTLKYILLGGQPDFEWTVQYNEYLANPGNPSYYLPMKQKVETTLLQLCIMPEYQTF